MRTSSAPVRVHQNLAATKARSLRHRDCAADQRRGYMLCTSSLDILGDAFTLRWLTLNPVNCVSSSFACFTVAESICAPCQARGQRHVRARLPPEVRERHSPQIPANCCPTQTGAPRALRGRLSSCATAVCVQHTRPCLPRSISPSRNTPKKRCFDEVL
jgi:hypothetical protein